VSKEIRTYAELKRAREMMSHIYMLVKAVPISLGKEENLCRAKVFRPLCIDCEIFSECGVSLPPHKD